MPQRTRLQSTEAATQRTRVRSEQDRMRSRFEQRKARILGSADTVVNALFVEVPDEATAAQLAALPGVKRVHPVRTYHMVLDQAVIQHKIPEAWNLIGQDKAGAGVKVAIIDSGIQADHPGFKDDALQAPDGYPKASSADLTTSTNSKVIVARSYVSFLQRRDPDMSPRDRVGHGTALAMIAAGARNAAPQATITGVAPKAFLGNYKVFGSPGVNDGSTDDAIVKAIDDAVNDGMDVINLSLGSDIAPRFDYDIVIDAVERASNAGVIVVCAAGNNGPDYTTISSPATAPSVIAAGAVSNRRTFASSVELQGSKFFLAIAGTSGTDSAAITAPLADVAQFDQNGLACNELPADSLSNRVALILRGTCTFEIKLTNAQRAGAVAAVVYAAAESPAAIAMATGASTLPAEMVSNADGLALKESASQGGVVTLRFQTSAVPSNAGRLTDFSATGPSVDRGIKPDVVAVGADVYTATQNLDAGGDMYSNNGFILVDGTSFSSPLVAGAAALLKSARPGLTVHHYRSLLINTAAEAFSETGGSTSVQQSGAGQLDMEAAVRSNTAIYPVSMSLGGGASTLNETHSVFVTNLGTTNEVYEINFDVRRGTALASAIPPVAVPAGGAVEVPIQWNAANLTAGAHEGFVTIRGTNTGTTVRMPYWYDVVSDDPANILILDTTTTGRRSAVLNDAILLRVTDAAGLPITANKPEVTITSGDTTLLSIASYDDEVPGLFGINLTLGPTPGTHVVQIKAGTITRAVSITVR